MAFWRKKKSKETQAEDKSAVVEESERSAAASSEAEEAAPAVSSAEKKSSGAGSEPSDALTAAELPDDEVELDKDEAGEPEPGSSSEPDEESEPAGRSEATGAASAGSAAGSQVKEPVQRVLAAGEGPYDVNDVKSTKGYLDFGALMVPAVKDQKVRLDIDQKTKRVVALTIQAGEASIQVQPFSAPKSGGTWDEVREQIQESVVKQQGKVKEVDGPFGKELAARVPTTLKDGRSGWRVARFLGYEGKRWFLRGVVGGKGAIDRKAAAQVEALFSQLVVVRGDDPLPPRELLPLRPPEGAKRVVVPRNPAQRRAAGQGPSPSAAAVSSNGTPDAVRNRQQNNSGTNDS